MKYLLAVMLIGMVGLFVAIARQDARMRTAHPCLTGRDLSVAGGAAASDGGMAALIAAVTRTMHDPRSFEHVATIIHPAGRAVGGFRPAPRNSIAGITYRGATLYGAVLQDTVVAEINPRTCAVVRVFG